MTGAVRCAPGHGAKLGDLQAQVGEHEGLAEERRELEEAAQRDLRVGRDGVVRVVRVRDAREEQRHDAAQLQHLHAHAWEALHERRKGLKRLVKPLLK